MHVMHKETSSTRKVWVVFDAFAKTSFGTSLNNLLLVGPTVHPSIIDVLLRFQRHWVVMTTDASWMYRVVLPKHQSDLDRFVWREDPQQLLKDYRMMRLTFGVSASLFCCQRGNEVKPPRSPVELSSRCPSRHGFFLR